MRALCYLLALAVASSALANPAAHDDDYAEEEEESWSVSNSKPPTGMLQVEIDNDHLSMNCFPTSRTAI